MKYRYLGSKGVMIDGKHYHGNDIVELNKPIQEVEIVPTLGVESFSEIRGPREKTKLTMQIESVKDEKKLFEEKAKKDIDSLKKAYDMKLKKLDDKIKKLERIYKEVYEPKKVEKKDKKEKVITKNKEKKGGDN